MLSFASDYITGAHERILARLAETNRVSMSGYSKDDYCESAKKKIKEACKCENAEIFFISGGTQTNQLVISTALATYEGVVAADTGHVSLHEGGAIEYTGHKVLTIPHENGKIMPAALKSYMEGFYADGNREQMVFPGMVYISHPTEYGTLYSADELRGLRAVCDEYKLPLFLDGARLAYALASEETDVDLPLIAELCDVFYIGGTKAGALCGEALVYTRNNMPPHFNTTVKQRGALLAKGRLFGVQFDELFTDGLYFEIGRHAVSLAMRMKKAFLDKGYKLHIDSYTNQQFVILEKEQYERLSENVSSSFRENLDGGRTVVRRATSFSTTLQDIEELEKLI